MKFARRSFLKMVGGGAAAVGAKAATAKAQGIDALQLPFVGPASLNGFVSGASQMPSQGVEAEIAFLKSRLLEVMGKKPEPLDYLDRLTPDAHSLQSVSLACKIRMSAQEAAKVRHRLEINHLKRSLRGLGVLFDD